MAKKRTPIYKVLYFQVICAIISGVLLGYFCPDIGTQMKPFGDGFIKLIKMIIAPVIFCTVVTGIAGMEDMKKVGKTGGLALLYFEVVSTVALIIGLFQALSIIPGTSRSGSTIIGGLVIGVSRVAAAEFTFFLAVPVMVGVSLLKMLAFGFSFTSAELITLIVGCVVAFLVSVVAIKFLMSYIKKKDFKIFGWYRIILGVIVIAYFLLK